jgi:hypothetical protein
MRIEPGLGRGNGGPVAAKLSYAGDSNETAEGKEQATDDECGRGMPGRRQHRAGGDLGRHEDALGPDPAGTSILGPDICHVRGKAPVLR